MVRLVCSKERPYDPKLGKFWKHPDAKLIGVSEDWLSGTECDRYKCPNCGLMFEVEVAR